MRQTSIKVSYLVKSRLIKVSYLVKSRLIKVSYLVKSRLIKVSCLVKSRLIKVSYLVKSRLIKVSCLVKSTWSLPYPHLAQAFQFCGGCIATSIWSSCPSTRTQRNEAHYHVWPWRCFYPYSKSDQADSLGKIRGWWSGWQLGEDQRMVVRLTARGRSSGIRSDWRSGKIRVMVVRLTARGRSSGED